MASRFLNNDRWLYQGTFSLGYFCAVVIQYVVELLFWLLLFHRFDKDESFVTANVFGSKKLSTCRVDCTQTHRHTDIQRDWEKERKNRAQGMNLSRHWESQRQSERERKRERERFKRKRYGAERKRMGLQKNASEMSPRTFRMEKCIRSIDNIPQYLTPFAPLSHHRPKNRNKVLTSLGLAGMWFIVSKSNSVPFKCFVWHLVFNVKAPK